MSTYIRGVFCDPVYLSRGRQNNLVLNLSVHESQKCPAGCLRACSERKRVLASEGILTKR